MKAIGAVWPRTWTFTGMAKVTLETTHTSLEWWDSHIASLFCTCPAALVLSKTAPDGFTRLDLSSFAGCPFSNPEGLPWPLLHPTNPSAVAAQTSIPDSAMPAGAGDKGSTNAL